MLLGFDPAPRLLGGYIWSGILEILIENGPLRWLIRKQMSAKTKISAAWRIGRIPRHQDLVFYPVLALASL
jgi:hypothetical protein